ncbi:MAG: hypothetical protein L0H84_21825 [Pseudonocardia sp.]|nr:hypothetical protein [Pseudonocardia sp.]
MSREHGTRAKYVAERCRCAHCRQAVREYERWRTRQRAYGRTAYVDAEPVRAHLRRLSEAGIGWKRAAALAGIASSTVWKLLYGDPKRSGAPSRRCRRRTAAAVLAVQPSLNLLGDATPVPAIGTQRRLQALVAIGWSQARLAGRIGMLPGNFGRTIARTSQVRASTARTVLALYDELWNRPPAAADHRSRQSGSRAPPDGGVRGWVPPFAWDDDTIDDPGAIPNVGETGMRVIDLDEVAHLADGGAHVTEIARRLGVTPAAIDTARRRAMVS